MIYITGDIHATHDIHKLNTENFSHQINMTKDDYLIICGDFGLIWNGSEEHEYWLNWLNDKQFTTLFVDGNHENFEMLYNYPEKQWKGGQIHKIKDSVYHLMRGYVFTIEGKTFFTMGGGESIDKIYRTEGKSWWKEEIPSPEELERGFQSLDAVDWKIDNVISHCCSGNMAEKIYSHHDEHNTLTSYFDIIETRLKFKKWFFGHHHRDIYIDDNHRAIYHNILKLED